jgi:hypothetical protein
MTNDMDFHERYGPWALIAGASEGAGSAFARQLAAQSRAFREVSSHGKRRKPKVN